MTRPSSSLLKTEMYCGAKRIMYDKKRERQRRIENKWIFQTDLLTPYPTDLFTKEDVL